MLQTDEQCFKHFRLVRKVLGRMYTRIVDGAVDGVTHTDGLDISTANLGETFPGGILVVQDDENETGGQNFKFVDLRSLTVVLEGGNTAH